MHGAPVTASAASQALNLRELIRKYGRNIGLNLKVVRVYTFQLLRVRPPFSFSRSCDAASILTDLQRKVLHNRVRGSGAG